MKILLTSHHPDLDGSDFLRSGNIVHAPALACAPAEQLVDTLILHGATALVTSRRPPASLLQTWSKSVPGSKFMAYAIGVPGWLDCPEISEFKQDDTGLDAIAQALRHCEQRHALGRASFTAVPRHSAENGQVVLIGAGIVGLVTALYLCDNGYEVTVFDRSPAPGSDDWHRYGCTHSGDDARMFTLTEMDNYNNQSFRGSAPDYFRAPITRNGWLAGTDQPSSSRERAWIEEFERIPSWLARGYNDDIFAFNSEAWHEWACLWRAHRRLGEDVVRTDGVLRVYSDRGDLDASLARHRRLGAVDRALTSVELARDFPALARSVHDGILAGGFLVPGFTLNVHKFAHRLVRHLEQRGVVFHWNTPVLGVTRDRSGIVTGFDCPEPIPATAHVVASPGVHGRALLRGSPCDGKIQGVLGGWMRISNEHTNLTNSLKVARKGHLTKDANITVAVDGDGREILIVGSGYGYVGETADGVDERQLAAMKRGIIDTITRLFPDRADLPASSSPTDNYGFKFCVRPWTATSLGVHHSETTAHDRSFIITGGHNTGGFAQSPVIARAVIASLRGEPHPMHALYHPERFSAFVDESTTMASTPALAARG